MASAVNPAEFTYCVLAAVCSNSRTTATLPALAASMRGVLPM